MHRTLWLIVLAILVFTVLCAGREKDFGITSTNTEDPPAHFWADQEGLILDPSGGPPRGLAEDPIRNLPPTPGQSDPSWYKENEWTAVVSVNQGHFVVVPNDDETYNIRFLCSFQNKEEGVWMTMAEEDLPDSPALREFIKPRDQLINAESP